MKDFARCFTYRQLKENLPINMTSVFQYLYSNRSSIDALNVTTEDE